MWCDVISKDMDLTHLRSILSSGRWCVSYSPAFVKQLSKAGRVPVVAESAGAELPGDALPGRDPMLGLVLKVAQVRGWHSQDGMGVNVPTMTECRTGQPMPGSKLPMAAIRGKILEKEGYGEQP